ncbi:unnamed protein product [Rhizophagus irregularis]|nr:unnamed protein product [Rhizophagus irregularis]
MDFTTYFNILRYLETLELPDNIDADQRRAFKRKAHYYVSIDGLLYKKNKESPTRPLRVLKKSELATVLYNFHEDPLAGHFGSDVQQDQQVEDFQEQFYQRIRMLIGPLEDNRQLARSNVHTSQEKQKQRYDAQIHPKQYAIGEQVLLKNFRPKKWIRSGMDLIMCMIIVTMEIINYEQSMGKFVRSGCMPTNFVLISVDHWRCRISDNIR